MSGGEVLVVKNLTVGVAGKTVLNKVSFSLNAGEVMALTGVNGSGKSSLAMTLMGHTAYNLKSSAGSKIVFDGKSIQAMSIDERARAGLFVAWQNPISIPGVSVFSLAKTACEARGEKIDSLVNFKNKLENILIRVGLEKGVVSRNINEGFSGGEKKRLELFWILLLRPSLVVIDEIDSGLDLGGRELVTEIVSELRGLGTAIIIISHYPELVAKINPDKVIELVRGQIKKVRKERA